MSIAMRNLSRVLRILACLDTGRKGSGGSSEKVFGVWEPALKNYT